MSPPQVTTLCSWRSGPKPHASAAAKEKVPRTRVGRLKSVRCKILQSSLQYYHLTHSETVVPQSRPAILEALHSALES